MVTNRNRQEIEKAEHIESINAKRVSLTSSSGNNVEINSEGQLHTTIFDEACVPAEVDDITHTLQTINYEHHEIHSGSHYFVCGYSDMSINNVFQLTFVTPDTTKWSHFIWKLDTESETLWEVYEAGVINTPLTNSIIPLNNNRNSLNTSGNTLLSQLHSSITTANTSVNVSGATLLCAGISGAGKTGSSDKREQEIILKQNTVYVLRATANAAGYIDFLMEWYEHTNKSA